MSEPRRDARSEIGDALNGKLDAEQVKLLMDEVLAITKKARGWCPECQKQVWVDIPDAKSVTGALTDLANQAWGRPSEVVKADADLIVNRQVFVVSDVSTEE